MCTGPKHGAGGALPLKKNSSQRVSYVFCMVIIILSLLCTLVNYIFIHYWTELRQLLAHLLTLNLIFIREMLKMIWNMVQLQWKQARRGCQSFCQKRGRWLNRSLYTWMQTRVWHCFVLPHSRWCTTYQSLHHSLQSSLIGKDLGKTEEATVC